MKRTFCLGILLISLPVILAAQVPGDEHWDDIFGAPIVENVKRMDANEERLVLLGTFHLESGKVDGVVEWNNRTRKWRRIIDVSALGSEIGVAPRIDTIKLVGDVIYIGGRFVRFGGQRNIIARDLSKDEWLRLAGGPEHPVAEIAGYGENGLLVATADTLKATPGCIGTIQQWDGMNWSLSRGPTATCVTVLAVDGPVAYVSEWIATPDGRSGAIQRLDGKEWSTVLKSGLPASSLIAGGDSLYAAVGHSIFKRHDADGHWLRLDAGFSVGGLASAGGRLFVGRRYGPSIAVWDGREWADLDGPDGSVQHLAVSRGRLYAAGDFNRAGDVIAFRLVEWDPAKAKWEALEEHTGHGPHGPVHAIAVGADGIVYVGGDFRSVGDLPARHVARWDGERWSAMGEGLPSPVAGLTIWKGDLYAGHSHLSVWDPDMEEWRLLPRENSDPLASITSGRDAVYVVEREGSWGADVAMWDGSTWTLLESFTWMHRAQQMWQVEVDEHEVLYVLGFYDFSTAQWDGERWSNLGVPHELGGPTSLAASGDTLFAAGGGRFGIRVAGEWRHVALPEWARVSAIEPTPLGVYLGFSSHSPGQSGMGVWRWTGTDWEPLGSGIDGEVFALAADGDDLYVGGSFWRAGAGPSFNFARWNPTVNLDVQKESPPAGGISLHQNYPNPFSTRTTIAFALDRPARHVELAVFDLLGRKIVTLVEGPRTAGRHTAELRADLPSGLYLCRLQVDGAHSVRRMMILR